MYSFDVEKTTKECVEWIRAFFEENGKGCNAVLGISGGKDSSVTAALLVEALGKDRVIGVLMPCGVQSDIDMAKLLVSHLGIKSYEVNIEAAVKGVIGELESNSLYRIRRGSTFHRGSGCLLFMQLDRATMEELPIPVTFQRIGLDIPPDTATQREIFRLLPILQ